MSRTDWWFPDWCSPEWYPTIKGRSRIRRTQQLAALWLAGSFCTDRGPPRVWLPGKPVLFHSSYLKALPGGQRLHIQHQHPLKDHALLPVFVFPILNLRWLVTPVPVAARGQSFRWTFWPILLWFPEAPSALTVILLCWRVCSLDLIASVSSLCWPCSTARMETVSAEVSIAGVWVWMHGEGQLFVFHTLTFL